MDLRRPWLETMAIFRWAATILCVLAASALMTGEADFTYMLIGASPFLFFLGASALWMLWKWATAPKWTRILDKDETSGTLDVGCPSKRPS
jgi:hypothetical protein